MSQFLSRIFFYIIPVLITLLFFGAEEAMTLDEKRAFYGEYGIAEGIQEITLCACLLFSLYILRHLKPDQNRWIKIWIGIAAFGCFYVFGEEMSWGQKFFGWSTPEKWAELNTQAETNIHNASQIFNRVPRTILEIGILVAGIIIPAMRRWAPSKLPERFAPIYANNRVVFLALITFVIKILEQFPGWFDIQIFWRKSEVIETFFYYFVFLYLVSILEKWKAEGRIS